MGREDSFIDGMRAGSFAPLTGNKNLRVIENEKQHTLLKLACLYQRAITKAHDKFSCLVMFGEASIMLYASCVTFGSRVPFLMCVNRQ